MSFKQEKKEHKSKSHILILRQGTGRMLITKKKKKNIAGIKLNLIKV